ncbi:MAG TPA: SAM-dependent chlorinase/fluorinase [Bacteroidales bacterium]|nr:SAM-dependent chlorinase/fluorinase [Bacteroidales bacterium]
MAVITLTTEWKPSDFYYGIIKGKLCTLCPGITILENAGGIPPYNLAYASFIIRNTYYNYPKGSIHIICVHSEAEAGRGYLIVKAKDHFFIGTDNGIFNLILNGEPDEVISIDSSDKSDELDVFSKAASGILSGRDLSDLGTPVKNIQEKFPLRATIDKDVIIGSIIYIDSYGNAISNITREIFSRVFEKKEFRILIQSNRNYTGKISQRYSDVPVGDLLGRFNQLDLLEIAVNGANVSELLSLETGSVIRVDAVNKSAPKNSLL